MPRATRRARCRWRGQETGHGRPAGHGRRRHGEPAKRVREPADSPIEQVIYRNEALARLRMSAEPAIGFGERLALFWSNHFCVSVGKGQIARATAGALEREAIRPHVFGRFSDMLLAVEKHPAMLFYLDNRQSVGPGSRAARNRNVGLNENLAREILELHTLGVDGGYNQADVTALARIITGWSFVGAGERLGPAGSSSSRRTGTSPASSCCWASAIPTQASSRARRRCATSPAIPRPRSIWRASWSAISFRRMRRRRP